MYQSLYRKYRPKNFNEIYGQNIAKKILINSIKNSKLSHAYLFFGPRGTGKTSIAKMYARVCNCLNPVDGNCCEKCQNCHESNDKNCVDIIEIDAASNNGVDEIRELKNKINLVPNHLKYKVYIIDEVHMLSIGAFNALLKTLEEPPDHVIFILATTDFYKVPSTIVSRCQTIEFKSIDDNSMCSRLMEISNFENINISEEAIHEIVKNSNGGLRDAIGLLDKLNSYVSNSEKITSEFVKDVLGTISDSELFDIIYNIKKGDYIYLSNKIDFYANSGKDLIKILNDLISFLCFESFENDTCEYVDLLKMMNEYSIKIKKSSNPRLLFKIFLLDMKNKTNVRTISSPVSLNKISPNDDINDNIIENSNMKIEKVNKISNKLVDLRINNCFSEANKSVLLNIQNIWFNLKSFVFDKDFGAFICDLLDCTPIVASEKYIILSSKYDSIVDKINQNSEKLSMILNDKLKLNQKLVCVTEKKWLKLKSEYLQKIKNGGKFEYIEEAVNNFSENVDKKVVESSDIEEKAKMLFGDMFKN